MYEWPPQTTSRKETTVVENKDNDNTLHIPIADRTKNGGTQQL